MLCLVGCNFADADLYTEEFLRFQSKVRVDAAQRAEGYRRAGGVKTQRSCVKALDVRELMIFA